MFLLLVLFLLSFYHKHYPNLLLFAPPNPDYYFSGRYAAHGASVVQSHALVLPGEVSIRHGRDVATSVGLLVGCRGTGQRSR